MGSMPSAFRFSYISPTFVAVSPEFLRQTMRFLEEDKNALVREIEAISL